MSSNLSPFRSFFVPIGLLALLGCGSSGPAEAIGSWGGTVASLELGRSGGALTYQCGTGTIDSAWTVDDDGQFSGVGKHYSGGGPVPSGGRPARVAHYLGRIEGNSLTLSVTLEEPAEAFAPFVMVRGGPSVQEICL